MECLWLYHASLSRTKSRGENEGGQDDHEERGATVVGGNTVYIIILYLIT